jgi:hypothetical protein
MAVATSTRMAEQSPPPGRNTAGQVSEPPETGPLPHATSGREATGYGSQGIGSTRVPFTHTSKWQ